MVAILEKTKHNTNFHLIVDFLEASHIRIETTNQETKILAIVDGKLRTISELSLRRHLKLNDEEGISSLPDAELFENLSLMGYNILPNQRFTFQKGQFSHQLKFLIHTIMQCLSPKSTGFNEFSSNIATDVVCLAMNRVYNFSKLIFDDEHASLSRDDRQGEVFPTVSSLDVGQDRENIANTSTLPHESSPRVTSLDAGDGNQDQEISELKERVKFLEDKESRSTEPTQEDAPITRGIMEIGEELGADKSTKLGSNDTKEMVNVLSSTDAVNILSSGGAPASVSPADVLLTVGVPTVSGSFLTVSAIFTTASVSKPLSKKEQREFYMAVLRSHPGWKTKHFRGITLEQIKEKFIPVWKKLKDFMPMSSKEEGMREYWKIIRLGGHTAVYQFFVDMLKQLDMEDLHQLWTLVKETLSIKHATKDKEKELWVELKRLFEPDFEDQLWTHNQAFMYDPLDWKLYDTCGVLHVSTKDQEIFMLVERDYPLRRGLATVMISNTLDVKQYSQMANDLILKIHNIANSLR
uniref:Synaptobrevin, longin-like domain protein n=1 Tax=Tanacetum cinerariifolium TaxID=118510 RepID=A0A6L2KNF5_TANCI|nr:synaptobrevin, longin-like domain protein [Tanacetum cinerariifolium]